MAFDLFIYPNSQNRPLPVLLLLGHALLPVACYGVSPCYNVSRCYCLNRVLVLTVFWYQPCYGVSPCHVTLAWVRQPERPKDEVKRPEEPPARSRGPEGPQTSVVYIVVQKRRCNYCSLSGQPGLFIACLCFSQSLPWTTSMLTIPYCQMILPCTAALVHSAFRNHLAKLLSYILQECR